MSTTVNYARLEGIEKSELPGAIVLAAVYVPLFIFNVARSIRHPTYVLIVLSFFCAIRVTAFTLRAILSGSDTAGENISLVIAESIIYSVGFFGLLYSAYTLVLDRAKMPHPTTPSQGLLGLLLSIISNRRIIRLALTAAVALGITAGSMMGASAPSTLATAGTLRKASTYLFLAVAACLVLVAAHLALVELSGGHTAPGAPLGRRHRVVVLLGIALPCLAREAFYAATQKDLAQQDNARLWYPLSALTELLAVALFAVPGLVPSRREIAEAEQVKTGGSSSETELHGYGA
ncbi:hypothetical protein PsYK624_135100 [Phanerochaete sordida]|uniref:DUF7702 domain-containing protein n=1 Tax=Phanerochaete sordida TaxID=48140 RepID=A0A9P3GPV4_9APHY|nr:hypothetical protein PsYK624_135100 [Phanerochaete sordida]